MDSEPKPARPRRWPMVLIAVAVVAVLVAAGVFVATREPVVESAATPSAPTTTLRPCVQRPTPVEGTQGADENATPPDGTYLVLISPVIGVAAVDVAVVEGGAALEFDDVPVADDVAITGQGPASITVRNGSIVGFDPEHATWDDALGRGDDPCTPRTKCQVSTDPVPHAWPGGIDGELGESLAGVPEGLSTALAKWGVDLDPDVFVLSNERCGFSAPLPGGQTLQTYLALTGDGYVLSGASTDEAEDEQALSYQADGDDITLPLPAVSRELWPSAVVDLVVRFGDRSEKASVPVATETIGVTIDRRMNQRGSFVLKYTDPDGTVRRLVATQIPAGDSAAS